MPSITNVGGSISTAVALTLLAWAIRTVRGASQRREAQRLTQGQPAQHKSRFACKLSPAAVRLLVGRSACTCPAVLSAADPPQLAACRLRRSQCRMQLSTSVLPESQSCRVLCGWQAN